MFKISRGCSEYPKARSPSHCFGHAAVSRNQFASFWEDADMDANYKNPKEALDAAIKAAQDAKPDRMDMENRAARVWARIGNELAPASHVSSSVEQIRTCEDYTALIPEFVAGRLSQARALLVRDHTHECVACR